MIRLICFLALATGCWTLYGSTSNVIELTPSNFDELVTNGEEIWIVEFFAPWCGHCQNLVPEYNKAAIALKGVVKVGAVDADKHKDLGGRFGLRGFPTIKTFGNNKNKPEDYNGARTAQGIVEAALAAVKSKVKAKLGGSSSRSDESSNSKYVIELTDSNFDKLVLQSDDMWLVKFISPWCSHCKNLAPHWAKAANELKGKVRLGTLDATVHLVTASRYGIQGYPTIKLFSPGPKNSDSVSEFNGGRSATNIVNWALDKLAENAPAPEITQIIDCKSFKENCEDKQLCVLAILPHILDCQSECRNNYIKTMTELGEKFKKNAWGWVWSEAGSQSDLENALDIGGFGYPAMVVINMKKMKYSLLRGSFSSSGINEFLRDLSYLKGNTAPVRGNELPKINQIKAWDGKDGELPAEEDIDSSEMELDEKDEL